MPEFRYIVHGNLQETELMAICRVKSLAFPYDVKSQEQWIRKNITRDDIHLLYKPQRTILAYLDMIRINLELDGRLMEGYGIGNVCSRQKGQGYGLKIMNEVNRLLTEEVKPGMLFCRKSLVAFYQKSGWKKTEKESVILSSPDHLFETMVYNCPDFKTIKYLGRLF